MKNNYYESQLNFGLKIIIFFFFLEFASNVDGLSQDIILTVLPANYTQNETATWEFISTNQYGVAGSGFYGKDQFIGKCSANYERGGPWEPIDGYKHTLCGQLLLPHNGKFEETIDDDGDIDIYIFPDCSFINLLLLSRNSNGNVWVPGTVLGEISFKEPGNNPTNDGAAYLSSLQPAYCLQNMGHIGIYGAWVTDIDEDTYLGIEKDGSHHDYHAEIHPIEQMWQTKRIDDWTTEFTLYSMHDNEGRFGTKDEFTYPGNIIRQSACDLPWIKNPQIDTFYIPFEVELSGTLIKYNIDALSGNNINSNSNFGNMTRLLYKGSPLITITRQSAYYPSIIFYKLGMKNANTIRGYIAIKTSIAKLGPGRTYGAHLFLKVTRKISKIVSVNPANSHAVNPSINH